MILNIDEDEGVIQQHTPSGWSDVEVDDLIDWLRRFSSQRDRNLGRWEGVGAVVAISIIVAVCVLWIAWDNPVNHEYEAQALPTLQSFGK